MSLRAIASTMGMIALSVTLTHCTAFEGFTSGGPISGQRNDGKDTAVGATDASSDGAPISIPGSMPVPKENLPVAPYKIAFLGDQGVSDNTRAVLALVKANKSDLMVILGDFDYEDDPDGWEGLMNEVLGDSFPVLAAIGNHDTDAWEGYRVKLEARLAKMKDVKCTGEYGLNMSCAYKNNTLVLSGVGTMGADHEAYLESSLKAANTPWKVCNWHKNQEAMQAGDKSDEVGWLAYETCRLHGAIVATGHEHSYSRTHLLSNFEAQTVASTDANLVMDLGKSFAFVSGLGGKSVRSQSRNDPYFAKIYTSSQNGTYGALFCEFGIENDPRKARCQFKNINNEIIDDFTLTSKLPVK